LTTINDNVNVSEHLNKLLNNESSTSSTEGVDPLVSSMLQLIVFLCTYNYYIVHIMYFIKKITYWNVKEGV